MARRIRIIPINMLDGGEEISINQDLSLIRSFVTLLSNSEQMHISHALNNETMKYIINKRAVHIAATKTILPEMMLHYYSYLYRSKANSSNAMYEVRRTALEICRDALNSSFSWVDS